MQKNKIEVMMVKAGCASVGHVTSGSTKYLHEIQGPCHDRYIWTSKFTVWYALHRSINTTALFQLYRGKLMFNECSICALVSVFMVEK